MPHGHRHNCVNPGVALARKSGCRLTPDFAFARRHRVAHPPAPPSAPRSRDAGHGLGCRRHRPGCLAHRAPGARGAVSVLAGGPPGDGGGSRGRHHRSAGCGHRSAHARHPDRDTGQLGTRTGADPGARQRRAAGDGHGLRYHLAPGEPRITAGPAGGGGFDLRAAGMGHSRGPHDRPAPLRRCHLFIVRQHRIAARRCAWTSRSAAACRA